MTLLSFCGQKSLQLTAGWVLVNPHSIQYKKGLAGQQKREGKSKLNVNRVLFFEELSRRFGNIYSLQFFRKKIVVFNGFEVMKEALINRSEDIADRPRFPISEKLGHEDRAKGLILVGYGNSWKEQRRFTLTTLRNFGMGKRSVEERVTEEAQYLCAAFSSHKGGKNIPRQHSAKGETNTSFNETNLFLTTNDLFGAGTETTSTTLRWALLYMLLYQDIQSKVHEEIDRVIGRDRKPTMEDLQEMPYTNAVIHEIQRCGDISPLALPHMTYRDMEIQGYFLPKGTTIFLNLSSVLKDELVWEKPYQFYPKHFLDDDGKFVKREAFMPFSAGRRVCLGEKLARMELFLFFITLMQQFTFEIPSKQPRPRDDPIYAFTLSPHPYEILAVPRV
uniref:Uncharacterized protein n=1 Tax=Pyxicephalus adspersus TaxID=30357 RepID=A0AAV2ZWB9_PYXAD|nr:TPA: hypothetical protein GDO54_016551 [Pyxicephalus adspersus]